MGKAIALEIRKRIISSHESGMSLRSLSEELGLSYSGVRQIWKRYRAKGAQGLAADYSKCGSAGPRFSPSIFRAACWLKRLNPSCGAPLIRARLKVRYPTKKIPSVRTLQNWFSQKNLQPRRVISPPTGKSTLGQRGS